MGVQPENITAAALLAQFLLVTVIAFATGILWKGEEYIPFYRERRKESSVIQITWVIIAFALATLGVLIFSDAFSEIWKPIFGLKNRSILPWSLALLLALLFDILWVGVMVFVTGGSKRSVFTPIYFLLPVFAILLREAPQRLLLYFVLVSISFTITLYRPNIRERNEQSKGNLETFAYWFVSIACFALATIVGYLTRAN